MNKYIIEGGYPIHGKIKPSGNKNAALPCIAATLLTDEPVVLKNVPDLEDVRVMMEILQLMGSTIEQTGKHEYKIQTHNIKKAEIPAELADKMKLSRRQLQRLRKDIERTNKIPDWLLETVAKKHLQRQKPKQRKDAINHVRGRYRAYARP